MSLQGLAGHSCLGRWFPAHISCCCKDSKFAFRFVHLCIFVYNTVHLCTFAVTILHIFICRQGSGVWLQADRVGGTAGGTTQGADLGQRSTALGVGPLWVSPLLLLYQSCWIVLMEVLPCCSAFPTRALFFHGCRFLCNCEVVQSHCGTASSTTELLTAARASKSKVCEFCSFSSINYATAMNRRAILLLVGHTQQQWQIQNYVCQKKLSTWNQWPILRLACSWLQ